MQQLRSQDAACLADRHSNLDVKDEAPAAVAASCCVPAQRMPASWKPKILRATTHCAHTDNLHTHDCCSAHRDSLIHSPHSTEIRSSYPHNHPHCASTDILHPPELHNLHKQYVIHPHCDSFFPPNVDDFTPLGTLGRGNMGTVILVLSKLSPRSPFALKISHPLSSKKQRSLHVEREILSSLHHPFLQTLHAHFESGNHSLLLLDFCSGGDLNLLRHRQPEKRFSETAARFYAAEVLVALEHLHKLGIVYRDLKPENILVQGSGHIKLTDFDLSLKLAVSANATARLPICSLQQQLDAETDSHFQLQAGKQRLRCRGFASLRGQITSRRQEGTQRGRQKIEEKGCGYCWIAREGGERSSSRRKEGAKQRCVCGLKCLCGTRDTRCSSRTRKKGANEGGLSGGSKCVGGREGRKAQKSKSTDRELRMSCLPCFKSKEQRAPEERSVYVVGTDEYVAPEVLKGEEHGFSMDWWSFGILLYEMIYGHTPFKGSTTEETLCNILEKKPEFPGMKSPAKHLIAQLLVTDPGARLDAKSIKQHPFFHGLHWESLPHICRPPFIPSPLCLSELEERYSAKLKAKRDALSITCKSWLDEMMETMEAAENSSQYTHTSSSAGFLSSSADGADRELRRDEDIDTLFSSAEWSSELDAHHPQP